MGAGASTKQAKPGAQATTVESFPTFNVTKRHNLDDCPDRIVIRVEAEAVMLLDASTQKQLRRFPYHRIMCWGHNPQVFKFRTYTKAGVGDAADESNLVNIVVNTRQGAQLEDNIMAAVRKLMSRMEAEGISDKEFKQLQDTLTDNTMPIATLKQVAMTRRFNIKQAVAVVAVIGELSPFDKAEAAAVLYDSLMSPDSFPMILEQFPDPADRENVCHRLNISVDHDGLVIDHDTKRVRRRTAAARATIKSNEATVGAGAGGD